MRRKRKEKKKKNHTIVEGRAESSKFATNCKRNLSPQAIYGSETFDQEISP